jgi:hypothetical protein
MALALLAFALLAVIRRVDREAGVLGVEAAGVECRRGADPVLGIPTP